MWNLLRFILCLVTSSTSNSQVDCLDFDSLDVCTEEGVEGFPTIYLYKDGMIEDIFSEERTIEKLENFVWQTVNPERVVDEFDPFSLLGDMSFDSNNEEEFEECDCSEPDCDCDDDDEDEDGESEEEDEENDGDEVEEDESEENKEVEKNEVGENDVDVEKDTEETESAKEISETTNDNEKPAETARDDSTKDEL